MDNVIVTITGDLSKLLNAIRKAGDVLGYKNLERVSGVHMAKAHYYVQALQDLGLVEIIPERNDDGIPRTRIHAVEGAGQ